METLNNKSFISETTVLQIVSVVAWLWMMPVISSLNSWSYGVATNAIMGSFIFLTLGIIVSDKFTFKSKRRLGVFSLVAGAVTLLLCLALYEPMRLSIGFFYLRQLSLFRYLGFALLGYGLKSLNFSMGIKSFGKGLIWLILLYGFYNLLIYSGNNISPDMKAISLCRDVTYALTRVLIVVTLWQTLSVDWIQKLLYKCPKLSLLTAGLFWGMIVVMPANHYSPGWLAIVMLLLAPVIAYIMTVLVRFSIQIIVHIVKGLIANKCWWLESCCWWHDKEE